MGGKTDFKRAELLWCWKQFTLCALKLDWLEDRLVNFPRHLAIDAISSLGSVGEWRPYRGIPMQVSESLGLDYYAVEGLSLFVSYRNELDIKWKLLFGSARHKGGIDDFRLRLSLETYEIAVMITPAEVEEGIWHSDVFWTQCWQCDSAKFGDALAGSWDVYVKSPKTYTSLEFSVPGRMMSSLRRVFSDNGLKFLENPHGVTFVRPIENSIG